VTVYCGCKTLLADAATHKLEDVPFALLLTEDVEPLGSGKVAVGGAEFVSDPRGLYRALALD
jgi:hypothetical protein